MRIFFELVQPIFIAFLIDVVKHELEVLTRGAEVDLVFATVELVVADLRNLVVDEDEAVDYVEHAF